MASVSLVNATRRAAYRTHAASVAAFRRSRRGSASHATPMATATTTRTVEPMTSVARWRPPKCRARSTRTASLGWRASARRICRRAHAARCHSLASRARTYAARRSGRSAIRPRSACPSEGAGRHARSTQNAPSFGSVIRRPAAASIRRCSECRARAGVRARPGALATAARSGSARIRKRTRRRASATTNARRCSAPRASSSIPAPRAPSASKLRTQKTAGSRPAVSKLRSGLLTAPRPAG